MADDAAHIGYEEAPGVFHAGRAPRGNRPSGRTQGHGDGGGKRERDRDRGEGQDAGDTKARVQVFLGEFRIIGPGLAALLGFQLTVAFQQSFETMGLLAQSLNFAGVACTAAALLFLLVPASYHRFTRDLADTEDFLQFARGCVHLAFAFLPVGLSAALALQALRTFRSDAAALAVGVLSLGIFLVAWWALPSWRARRNGA